MGAALGEVYFHYAVAPGWENEFNRGYIPVWWGYVIYTAPVGLVGALVGAVTASD